jgi:hypothetical protein
MRVVGGARNFVTRELSAEQQARLAVVRAESERQFDAIVEEARRAREAREAELAALPPESRRDVVAHLEVHRLVKEGWTADTDGRGEVFVTLFRPTERRTDRVRLAPGQHPTDLLAPKDALYHRLRWLGWNPTLFDGDVHIEVRIPGENRTELRRILPGQSVRDVLPADAPSEGPTPAVDPPRGPDLQPGSVLLDLD